MTANNMIKIDDNTLHIHASSIEFDAGAVLFLGHSTAGKSTIAWILSEASAVIADDSVILFRDSLSRWNVMNGEKRLDQADPSFGKIERDEEVKSSRPLLGCFRLYKAETVKSDSVEPIRLAQYLMDAVMEVDMNRVPKTLPHDNTSDIIENCRRRRRHWFHLVAEVSKLYPGWDLWFSKKSTCLELISNIEANIVSAKDPETRCDKKL